MTTATTDTPRTDAVAARPNWPWHIQFEMRQLERELSEAKAEVERLSNGMQGSCYLCEPVGEMNQKLEAEVERLKNDFNELKTLMHQTIWIVYDMIKTHANGCLDCHKKHGAMISLFKDITEEPQWPIEPTDK